MATARADLDVIASRLSAAARSGNQDRTEHLDVTPSTMSALPEIRSLVLGVGFTLVAEGEPKTLPSPGEERVDCVWSVSRPEWLAR